ncbi:uncharacterized protein AKAME5_001608000 [Lates japonicus]|uniref:PGC-1 and ERR-induced regulator in muscle protein 1 n=1 Tax=Lates japonicus TaxID=270547 RepID=A0AAD3N2F1_LATJO|nr:uncharacterized protein AKAME5_001608000 [Lates japonicus]
MHIADFDWTNFYDESEECCLLQPSLACPDNLSLSDSEDPENSSPVFNKGQKEIQQSPDVSGDGAESNASGCSTGEENSVKLSMKLNDSGEQAGEDSDSEICLDCLEGSAKEVHMKTAEDITGETTMHVQCPGASTEPKKEDRDLQMETDHSRNEPDPLSLNQTEPNENEPNAADGATSEDASGVSPRAAEKERWFVTLESAESDEFENGVEFFSSYDSESYLSAAESVEDTQHLLIEKLQPVDLIQLQRLGSLTSQTESDSTQDRKMLPCDSVLSCNAAATDCDGYERADVEPTLTFPSAGQRAKKMPDDNPACDDNTQHSTVLHTLSDTPGFQNDTIHFSASGSSSGYQLNPPPVPDLTVTPCPAADSPETYAEAAGHTRPVYAISAFWDEMEKLTINDILQLRMGKSTPPRETQETAMANEDESPTSRNSLVDTVQYSLSDSGLMDASDTADSDYFTQPDESKLDRSSCEFSTSDFEEEYWQFLGASRNPSPDPQSKNQRTDDSPFLSHEEWSSTSSEGKETPVPLEDFEGQWFENQESRTLSELAWPRRIAKSKSMHNVQALNTDDSTLPFGDDETSLFLSSCQSLEDNVVLKVSDSLGTLIPAPLLSNTDILDEHYQISFPEVFEYFFADDKTKTDSRCIAVYDPDDISVAPTFGYTLCTFRDELPFSSLHDSQCSEEKPIPIFSCSHPTIRELTFPKSDYVFLSADCKMAAEEVDDFSPIRVVSRSFIWANQHGTSAAATGGSRGWKSLLSMRKICFHNKGSIWCRRSGAWVFPVKYERTERKHPPITALTEGKGSSTPSQLLTVQQSILATIQTTKQEGIFSTLKQSDMCLVCIAFASWVLKSSDPEAADAWKAALLANVSALSAIQYLRHYVKKRSPQDDP